MIIFVELICKSSTIAKLATILSKSSGFLVYLFVTAKVFSLTKSVVCVKLFAFLGVSEEVTIEEYFTLVESMSNGSPTMESRSVEV